MFARIAPLRRMPPGLDYFDYDIPSELTGTIKAGSLVWIPFKKTVLLGLVMALSRESQVRSAKLITADTGFVLPAQQLGLLRWLSDYYHYPASLLLPLFVPELPSGWRSHSQPQRYRPLKAKANTPKPRWVIYDSWLAIKKIVPPLLTGPGQTLLIYPDQTHYRKIKKLLGDRAIDYLDIPKRTAKQAYTQAWGQAPTATVIMGNWQSLFWPYSNLKRIIVVETDNPLYHRAEQNPRLHLNDYLWQVMVQYKAELHLFSLAPPVQMMHTSQRYQARVVQALMAQPITLRDVSAQKSFGLSSTALTDIRQTPKQVLIFQNFLGSAGHKQLHSLQALLHKEFPERTIGLYGGDSQLTAAELKRTDIVIATSKIFSTPLSFALTLIIGADAALARPDYKAAEDLRRHINKLKQISRSLIIESVNTEHPFWQTLHDYKSFYQTELLWRRKFHYPPFSDVYKIFARLAGSSGKQALIEIQQVLPDARLQTEGNKFYLLVRHEILDTLIDKILKKYHNQILIEKNPYNF